jgi:hypothetical protein
MSAPQPDHHLEAEIRAMLQRRAQDVRPAPPPWRELAQRNGAVVISLRTGAAVDRDAARRRRRPSRQWFRGAVAAALALIVAMVGALLVQGSDPAGDTADRPEPLDVPSAGQADFDPARATPLFPVTDDASTAIPSDDDLGDPTATAEAYLGSVRLPVGEEMLVVDEADRQSGVLDEGAPPVRTATVGWRLHARGMTEHPLSQGTVWLRTAERGGRETWLVVGVSTRTLLITDIRRHGQELTFTVDRTTETETFRPDPAEVSVNGEVVAEVGYREARAITVPSPAGEVAVISLQIMDDGEPWSITSTAVPAVPGGATTLPDLAPVPSTVTVEEAPRVSSPGGAGSVVAPSTGPAVPPASASDGRVVVSPG